MAAMKDERTLGEMFAEFSREARSLVQQEIQLAKAEVAEKASKMKTGLGFVVGGGLLVYGGFLAVIAASVLILIRVGLPPWAGALLGGLLLTGTGYAFIQSGLARLRPEEMTPRRTIETLKEDAQWLKTQTK
jgi:hypothetical protein